MAVTAAGVVIEIAGFYQTACFHLVCLCSTWGCTISGGLLMGTGAAMAIGGLYIVHHTGFDR
ncbi:MAG: hypothetical protein OK456_11535, partial [Thaumarchaeota archaeon]|nr:hypothetical protein [Nitrososphaerota archaeon]